MIFNSAKVLELYLDSAMSINVVSVSHKDANSFVFVDGKIVKGPIITSPMEYIARSNKGLCSRRGILIGVYKRMSGMCGMCVTLYRNSLIIDIHDVLRRSGVPDITRELVVNTHRTRFGDKTDAGTIDAFPHVLMPGLENGWQRVRLGAGWEEVRGNDKAVKLLDSLVRSFHNVMYGI